MNQRDIVVSDPPQFEVLVARIRAETGLDDEQMQKLREINRYVPVQGGPAWKVGDPPPGAAAQFYRVVAIFAGAQADKASRHRPGDMRVYCAPTVKHYAGTQEEVPFGVYTLNTSGGDMVVEGMNLEVFIGQCAYEFKRLAVLFDVIEDEDEDDDKEEDEEWRDLAVECPSCHMSTLAINDHDDDPDPPEKFCGSCGKPLPVEAAPAT